MSHSKGSGLTKGHDNVVVAPAFMAGVTLGINPNATATAWLAHDGSS